MLNRHFKLYTALLGVFLFALFTFVRPTYEICCMFAATRYYGFPYEYVALHHLVDTYSEAERIMTAPTYELLKSGWRPALMAPFDGGLLGSPMLGLAVDLLFSLAVAFVIMKVIQAVRKKSKV